MINDTVTLQLVTLAIIDEDGFLDGENTSVGCVVFNSDSEYVTTLPLREAMRLSPKACLDDFVNPSTKEVYQPEEIITLYEHEGYCYAITYAPYTQDLQVIQNGNELAQVYYPALAQLERFGGLC